MTARMLLLLLATLIIGGSVTSLASAYWTGFEEPVSGMSMSHATTLNDGPQPIVSVDNAASVTVTWAPSSAADGSPVDGYRVARYDSATHVLQSIGSGCSGVRTTQACTELSVPFGSWTYAMTPTLGTNWLGAEGPESAPVVVGSKTLVLAQAIFGASLPATTTGTLTGFLPDEAITFELDGQPISGNPSQVDSSGDATITSLTIPAGTADGWHDLVAVGHALPAPSRAVVSVLVDSVAPTFTPVTIPTPNAAGWNNTSPVEVNAVYSDGAGSGLAAVMYTTDGTDPTISPTVQVATGPLSVSSTETQRYYAVDVAGNATATRTHEVKIDTQAPTYSARPNIIEGGAHFSALGVFYRGEDPGRITVTTTVVDEPGGSGAASVTTHALTGLASGFSHVASVVSTPDGGPYESNEITWVPGATSDPYTTLSVTDRAGNVATRMNRVYNDSAPPIGGAVDATGLAGSGGRYATSLDLAIELTPGVDTLSGLAGVGAQLLRATAPLEAGSCATYGSYAQVGPDDPASTFVDTVPSDHACYRYRYRVPDHVGNWATYQSPDIKVGAVAASTLRPSGVAITPVTGTSGQHVSGTTIYVNPSASGSFRVEAATSDAASGVQHLVFPTMIGLSGGGMVSAADAPGQYHETYAWVAPSPVASPGVEALSAMNGAGQTLTNTNAFVVQVDGAGPTVGSVTAPGLGGGVHSATTTVQLELAAGADAGSGVAASAARLWRASATMSSSDGVQEGNCGAFGPYTEIAGAGSSTALVDTVPADSTCYRYAYHAMDNVGNVTVFTSGDIEVDTTAPSTPSLTASDIQAGWWSVATQTLFYRASAASGGFTITASSTDSSDGVEALDFPVLPAGWGSTAVGFDARRFTWQSPNPAPAIGFLEIVARNYAGLTSTRQFQLEADVLAPSDGSVSYTDGYVTTPSVSVNGSLGADTGSGVAASSLLTRSTAAMTAGACGAFAGPVATALPAGPPYLDTGLASGSCYRYTLTAFDMVGNAVTYSTPSVAKVDYVGPTHSLALTSAVNASITGSNVYYRGNVAGSFGLEDALADSSPITSATFPGIAAAGWTHAAETIVLPSGGPYSSSTFSWTGTSSAPGAYTVTASDAAGNVGSQPVTFVRDIMVPIGGSITYPNGLTAATTVALTTVLGTDALSGVTAGDASFTRSIAKLNGNDACGMFGGWSALVPVAGVDMNAPAGSCYRYRFTVLDKVGNAAVYSSTNVVRVTS